MAGAIINGLISGGFDSENITVSDVNRAALEKTAKKTGIVSAENNTEAVKRGDIIILAVKPHQLGDVLDEIRDVVSADQILVTLAPGRTLKWIRDRLNNDAKVVRTMPNTPALVGEGMTAICPNENITEEELTSVKSIFGSVGKTAVIPEILFDVSVGVSSSSPAFVFMFIEAMADAAVLEGMSRQQAYAFAAQAVYGSAKLVLDTGIHPGELKDRVCSPGGTTIEGVRVLENGSFRGTVMEAVSAAVEKSRNL